MANDKAGLRRVPQRLVEDEQVVDAPSIPPAVQVMAAAAAHRT